MRGLVALVHKEWRDIRALTWTYLALVPVAMLVVRWVLGARTDGFACESTYAPRFVAAVFPACVLLYASMVASDVVAGDVASRRADQLALLPTGLLRVWCAKVATLVLATALVAAGAFVAQVATIGLVDGWEMALSVESWSAPPSFVVGVWESLDLTVAGAAIVAAVLLASSVGCRGLAAVLAGGGFAAGLVVLQAYFLRGTLGWTVLGGIPCATAAAVAMSAASAVAFVRGMPHLGARLRPLGLAAATFAGMLVVPGGAYATAAGHVAPGSDLCFVAESSVSPYGPFAAITWTNRLSSERARATWVLRLDDGVLVPVASGRTQTWGWEPDGTLSVMRWGPGDVEVVSLDPATGLVARTESYNDRAARSRALRQRAEASVVWHFAKTDVPGLWRVYAAGRPDETVRSVVRPILWNQGKPSLLVACDLDHLDLVDLGAGTRTQVAAAEGLLGAGSLQPIGSGLVKVRRGDRWSLIDVERRTLDDLPGDVHRIEGVLWKGARIVHVIDTAGRRVLLDVTTGRRVATGSLESGSANVHALADGGVVLLREDGSFARYDASLGLVRAGVPHLRSEIDR